MQSLAFEIDDKEVVKIVYKNSDHENPKTGLFSNLDVLPQILEMLNTVQDVPNAAIVASYIKGAIMAKEILAARKAAQATRIQSGTPQSSICSVQ